MPCALAGQTGGAIWVVLDFFALLFALRQKVEKEILQFVMLLRLNEIASFLAMTDTLTKGIVLKITMYKAGVPGSSSG